MSSFGVIEKLRKDHQLDDFDCGKPGLNDFLKRHARQNQQNNSSVTYVLANDLEVGAYYSLAVGSVTHTEATAAVTKRLSRYYPVPILLLARLAVTKALQGRRIGEALLKDAFQRAAATSDVVGIAAFVVHAMDEEAKAFYLRYDFEESPTDPLHLFIPMKDIHASLPK